MSGGESLNSCKKMVFRFTNSGPFELPQVSSRGSISEIKPVVSYYFPPFKRLRVDRKLSSSISRACCVRLAD
jgi:hypothetical protein